MVAFGLACASAALKAKAGLWSRPLELELITALAAHCPGDADAKEAVRAFLRDVSTKPAEAGDGLLAFLDTAPDGAPLADQARKVEAVLRDPKCAAPERYEWQDRKDIEG